MTKTQELLGRRANSVARAAATTHPIFVEHARDAEIIDVEGKRYIDFASGIAVINLGHQHPAVTNAIKAQLDAYSHVGFPVSAYEPYIAVCEELNARAPIANPRSALFTTGAEAIENAVKVARIATGRVGIITFTGSFHGRTNLAAAMTGKIAPLRSGVQPTTAGVFHAPFPGHGATEEEAIAALRQLFRVVVAAEQVAAIVLEPVQGEGGFVQAPASFMRALRQICDDHGICLIADEIQSGFGRTGRFFAMDHYDVKPDLITVGKAIGGGLPLAGLIGRAELMDACPIGALGGTYAGNPVACAAALAVFETIDDAMLERVRTIGEYIASRVAKARESAQGSPIGEIRQIGAMVAFDMVTEHGGSVHDADAAKALATRAREAGVLFLPCGYEGATIRLSVPFTVSDEILKEGLDLLTQALGASPEEA